MATTLEDLPVELVRAIVEEGDPRDILSLRLLSRTICAKVDDSFTDAYFTHRRHAITAYSLQALTTISADSKLCRKLQSIDLVLVQLGSWNDPQSEHDGEFNMPLLRAEYDNERTRREQAEEDEHEIEEEKKKARDELRRKQRIWEKWIAECDQLAFTDDLCTAFRNLKAANVIPALQLSSHPIYPKPAFGFQRLENDLGNKLTISEAPGSLSTTLRRDFQDQDVTRQLLEAIGIVNFPVKVLNLSTKVLNLLTRSMPCSLDHFELALPDAKSLRAFSYLRSLSMDVKDFNSPTGIQHFHKFMASLTSLDSISIIFDTDTFLGADEEHHVPREFVMALCHKKLRSIQTEYGAFLQEDLEALLQYHRDTLTDLKLGFISLAKDGDWKQIFRLLTESFELQKIEAYMVQQGYIELDRMMIKCDAGVEAVRAVLQDQAQNAICRDTWESSG